MRPIKLTCTRVTGAILDGIIQVVERNVANGHRGGVGFDPHRRLSSINSDLADAGEDADALTDLSIGIIVELSGRDGVTGKRDVKDRLIVGVRLGECGRAWQI